MKDTALTNKHIDLGAKMVPFAGYNMPVQYAGVNVEHETVRNGVGVFDVSHMGDFGSKDPMHLTFYSSFVVMIFPNSFPEKHNTITCPMKKAEWSTT